MIRKHVDNTSIHFWTISDRFGQFLTNLDNFGQFLKSDGCAKNDDQKICEPNYRQTFKDIGQPQKDKRLQLTSSERFGQLQILLNNCRYFWKIVDNVG